MLRSKACFESLPRELRSLVWEEVFAETTLSVHEVRSISKIPPADGESRAQVFTNDAIADYTSSRSFQAIAAEIDRAFFKVVLFDFDGHYDHDSDHNLHNHLFDTTAIHHIKFQSTLLSHGPPKLTLPSVADYTQAYEHDIVLPEFPNLHTMQVTDWAGWDGRSLGTYVSSEYIPVLLHCRRSFSVSVKMPVVWEGQTWRDRLTPKHFGKAFVTKDTCKFIFEEEEEFKVEDIERLVRDNYGVWEDGKVGDDRLVKLVFKNLKEGHLKQRSRYYPLQHTSSED